MALAGTQRVSLTVRTDDFPPEEVIFGRSGVMRHNMGMPDVKLRPVSEPGRNEQRIRTPGYASDPDWSPLLRLP